MHTQANNIVKYEDIDSDVIVAMRMICGATGRPLTEEQAVFASDFRKPSISFADAGTGKTYAATVGVVLLQKYYGMHGSKICVISFTNEAVYEIAHRYDKMKKFSMVTGTPMFSTFHSVCSQILRAAYGKYTITRGNNYLESVAELRRHCESVGIEGMNDAWLKRLLLCINYTNSAFIFDPDNLKECMRFKSLDIDTDQYLRIKRKYFLGQKMSKTLPQGDIPIHCMYALSTDENIMKKYGKMFSVMVVDEFQDMSPLYMKIVTMLSESVTVIGDMKQQIYAFNGASDDIVRDFKRQFPDARVCPLTQSFRCADEIIDRAMEVESPNKPVMEKGTGVGPGGTVNIIPRREMDVESIAKNLAKYQSDMSNKDMRDVMFLARNNLSIIYIIEVLYQNGVRFRSNKFQRVMDIPIFSEMCKILEAIEDPSDVDKVWNCLSLFREFKWNTKETCPIIKIMKKDECSWFDIKYQYKNDYMVGVINLFIEMQESMWDENMTAGRLFNTLFPVYENYIIEGRWWMLEMDRTFYINLVAPIVNKKSWSRMVAEEKDKFVKNAENVRFNTGVRCYTIHSSKGLEADEVYIADCDKGIVPSDKNLEKYIKAQCEFEASRMLRNERNLLYVAITRARKEVNICYSGELSTLISSPKDNEYSYLDDVYEAADSEYENLDVFLSLYNLKGDK